MKRILLLALLLPVLSACDAGQPEEDQLDITAVLFTETDGTVAAYSHEDHWHGTLRATAGQSKTLRVWLVAHDDHDHDHGHDVPPEDLWVRLSDHAGLSLRLTSDNEPVATWSGSSDMVTLASSAVGAALTTVVVLEGSTTLFQSSPAPTISSPAPPTAAPTTALAVR